MIHDWTADEAERLARAVSRAPSVHNLQPWLLELAPGEARLRERRDLELPYHDPDGRDRIASCGAALAHLELAVRTLGHTAEVTLLPDDLVARVRAGLPSAPTAGEWRLYDAIAHRASHRGPFRPLPVGETALHRVIAAGIAPGVEARAIRDDHEIAAVAKLLHFAAEKFQDDSGYQRELSLWTIRDEAGHRHGVGIPASRIPPGALPWAGLIRTATEVPDVSEIRERLAGETLIVFVTADDTRLDHLRAGYAMERAWLAAVDAGLAGAVLTQPLHLEPVRATLCEDLTLSGFPLVLMRLGYSGDGHPPPLRRATGEILRQAKD